MQNDLARLSTISQNIANVTTPGYKKQIASVFATHLDNVSAVRGEQRAPSSIDTASGPLRPSTNPNDVAIEGDGFFELVTPQGPAFTRRGSLHVDADGVLVGAQGFPVSGGGGAVRLLNSPFSIAANGNIEQAGRVVAQLKIVHFDNASTLQAIGNGAYEQGAARLSAEAHPVRLRSGFLEGSNVSSPQEMVRLSETVRHFEALQRIVQGYDETLEKAIRKLGDF